MLIEACKPSEKDLILIRDGIKKRLLDKKYANVSVVIAGDFNSMSHLDYSSKAVSQYKQAIDWPTSHVMTDAGFRDSYREINHKIDRSVDSTWSPRFPKQEQDRIDFIYYKSEFWRAAKSTVIREHPVKFPSDHAAVLTTFRKTMKNK